MKLNPLKCKEILINFMKYPKKLFSLFALETASWSVFRSLNFLVLKLYTILN